MPDNKPQDWLSVPLLLEGVSLNKGLGMGYALCHSYTFTHSNLTAENIEVEKERLKKALETLHKEIDELFAYSFHLINSEVREILEIYRLLAKDKSWQNQLYEYIESGLCAEEAVDQAIQSLKEKFAEESFWQSRLYELEDIGRRLRRHLGGEFSSVFMDPDQPFIVVARSLGAAELIEYQRRNLKGVILADSSQTSHMAIIARSLGIPVVGAVDNIFNKVRALDPIVVDGDTGRVYIRPIASLSRQFNERSAQKSIATELPTASNQSAVTLDGIKVTLHLNANLSEDLKSLSHPLIEGVGLYRTEIPFMFQDELPSVSAQTRLYHQVLDIAEDKPVFFRTLDIGEDKIVPALGASKDERSSKSLRGWRAIRLTLDRPMIMRQQLRALIRARCQSKFSDQPLYLMIPMLAEVSEFIAVRQLVSLELERERKIGNAVPQDVKVGAMIEVPALVYQLPYLQSNVDFFCVGSNDLFQFFYAIDRDNRHLFQRYDVLSPAFLMFLKSIRDQLSSYPNPLSFCGEMASDPLEAMALLGLGFRTLSVAPAAMGDIYQMISSVNLKKFVPYLLSVCQQMSLPESMVERGFGATTSLRHKLSLFARDHSVRI